MALLPVTTHLFQSLFVEICNMYYALVNVLERLISASWISMLNGLDHIFVFVACLIDDMICTFVQLFTNFLLLKLLVCLVSPSSSR